MKKKEQKRQPEPVGVLPETGFIRLSQVLALVPVSKSTLLTKIKQGTFPAPVKLSERIPAWRVQDVKKYIELTA